MSFNSAMLRGILLLLLASALIRVEGATGLTVAMNRVSKGPINRSGPIGPIRRIHSPMPPL